MKCEKCEKNHDGSFGSGRFCSRECANSRIRTDEIKSKISEGVKKHIKNNPEKYFLSDEQIRIKINKHKQTCNQKLLQENFDLLKFERLRKRVILEQEEKCNRCGLSLWLDKPIVLELEHKDGNNENNKRENVEAICPNCHSLTNTWRGKNKKRLKKAVSDEEVVESFLRTGNIRQCLLYLGIAAKGSNYGRVKRALTLYNIKYN